MRKCRTFLEVNSQKSALMEDAASFYEFLNRFTPLPQDEFDQYILPRLQLRTFPRRALITHSGSVEEYLNFVLQGVVRKYYVEGGEEVSVQFATEGHIVLVQESFISRAPCDFILEASEAVRLISVRYDDLEQLYDVYPRMDRLGRLVISFIMMLKDRWQMNLIRMTARERFLDFVQKNPGLLQRVSQKQLASYLQIQPETFSRFKHLIK